MIDLKAKLARDFHVEDLVCKFADADLIIKKLQAENAELKRQSESLKLNLELCCNHLSLALNLDEIEDEDDKSSIHSKANDFIVTCSETLKGE